MIVALCLGHASDGSLGYGLYLKDFDFEAAHDERAPKGSGRATFTDDPAEAKRFADIADFFAFSRTVPKETPARWWSDGDVNRPMTGYNWTFVTVPEAST